MVRDRSAYLPIEKDVMHAGALHELLKSLLRPHAGPVYNPAPSGHARKEPKALLTPRLWDADNHWAIWGMSSVFSSNSRTVRRGFVSKFFYPLLMLATAGLAIALWRQQESSCHLLGPEDDPNSETSNSPYDDPNAGQRGIGPSNRPGMFPGYSPINAPIVPSNSGRPANWPGGPATKINGNEAASSNGISISSLPPSRDDPSRPPVRFDPAVTPVQYQAPLPGASQYPTTSAPPVGLPAMPAYTPMAPGQNPNAPAATGPTYIPNRGALPPNYPSAGSPNPAPGTGVNRPVVGPPPASYPNTSNYASPQQSPANQTQQTSFNPQSPQSATSSLSTNFAAPIDIDGTRYLATVNGEPIMAYEVMVTVNEMLKNNADKIQPQQYEQIKEMLIKQRLRSIIESRMMVVDAKRKLPKEALPKIEAKLAEVFEEQETKKILKRANLKSRGEWDAKLREMGSSVEREKRQFIDNTLGSQWMHQQIKTDKEVTHQDMLDYYYAHIKEYEYPAQCRWEQLSVRISKHRSMQEAWQAMASMGNRVYGGAPFADVAKNGSDGITAASGGTHDWTIKGSLSSTALDQALFTLPLGQLSPIIEDQKNLHIVRVIERKEAGRESFEETQTEIKGKIKQERINAQVRSIVARIRTECKVWTVYGDIMTEDEEKPKAQAASPNKVIR